MSDSTSVQLMQGLQQGSEVTTGQLFCNLCPGDLWKTRPNGIVCVAGAEGCSGQGLRPPLENQIFPIADQFMKYGS